VLACDNTNKVNRASLVASILTVVVGCIHQCAGRLPQVASAPAPALVFHGRAHAVHFV